MTRMGPDFSGSPMTTSISTEICTSSSLPRGSHAFRRLMKQARLVGIVASVVVSLAALPLLWRLLQAVDVPVFSPVGALLAIPVLALTGLFTARWARCNFVREVESQLADGSVRDGDPSPAE